MRRARLLAVGALILGVAACGAEKDARLMPDVTGQPLDAALSAIEDAGVTDDVDIEGGGMFGVVDEGNWQVCEQEPAVGSELTGTPRLTVDRSCDEDPEGTPPEEDPAAEAVPTPSEPPVITAATDPAFAAVLAEGDICSDAVAQFADQNEGRIIELDGNVGAMNNSAGYTTRYDILLGAGDYSETTQTGPAFQFRDVNTTSDLHWTGETIADTVGIGDNLHVVAQVDRYDSNACLFLITPVATSFR